MKLTDINEDRRKLHTAKILGREYDDISLKKAKLRAINYGATLFWWDNIKYAFNKHTKLWEPERSHGSERYR